MSLDDVKDHTSSEQGDVGDQDDEWDQTSFQQDDGEPSNRCDQTSWDGDGEPSIRHDQTSWDDGEPSIRHDQTPWDDDGEPSIRHDQTSWGWDDKEPNNQQDQISWDDRESSDQYDQTSFKQTYRCHAIPSAHEHIESGNRILMPMSALERLDSLDITYPMMFEISNPSADKSSHCGVLEFTADEGTILLPQWMMKNLLLQEADTVVMKNVTLPTATFMKFQPHTMNFLNVPEPREVLEAALKNYSCVTTGDTIMIADNDESYYIDIVETKPSNAVSIIQIDCPVDFAPPLDYKEPQRLPRTTPVLENSDLSRFMGMGIAKRLDGKPSKLSVSSGLRDPKHSTSTSQPPGGLFFGSDMMDAHQESMNKPMEEMSKFQPFTGKKYILNPESKA